MRSHAVLASMKLVSYFTRCGFDSRGVQVTYRNPWPFMASPLHQVCTTPSPRWLEPTASSPQCHQEPTNNRLSEPARSFARPTVTRGPAVHYGTRAKPPRH